MKLYLVTIIGDYPDTGDIEFGIFDKEKAEEIANSINEKIKKVDSDYSQLYDSIRHLSDVENNLKIDDFEKQNEYHDEIRNYDRAIVSEFKFNQINEEEKHFLNT
jgi:uncharacterized protein YfcZ (UPF0381/DUF406 family)